MFLLPLLELKKKIHQLKKQQIKALTLALNGDKDALKDTYLGRETHAVSITEIIIFRQYIEKVNE
jgi:hypothetical protein